MTLASNMDNKSLHGEAFNFGSSQPISVLSLYDEIIKLMGKKVKPKILGEAKNEIDRQYLSIEKVKRLLNWAPKYTISDGLKETIEWYREFLKRKN